MFVERVVNVQKWDVPGEQVEGILLDVRVKDYPANEKGAARRAVVYKLETGDGLIVFGGTTDLNQKVLRSDRGKKVRITYLGEDPAFGRNGNQMKNFKVEFDSSVAKQDVSGLEITDDDIPF